jgi:hypothetical protein
MPSNPFEPEAQQDREVDQQQSEMLGTSNGVNGLKLSPIDDEPKLPVNPVDLPKPRKVLSKSESEKVSNTLAAIDDTVFSDPETGNFAEQRELYRERSRKRARRVEDIESQKCKVRSWSQAANSTTNSVSAPPYTPT